MDDRFEPMVDLTVERQVAIEFAEKWGLELEAPFGMSNVSYVAPTTGGAVLKVPWRPKRLLRRVRARQRSGDRVATGVV